MNFNDFSYFLFKIFEFIIKILPANFLINFIGFLGYKLDKKRKKAIQTNLNLAFSDKSEEQKKSITKQVYKNFVRNAIEVIKNKKATKEDILNKVEFENFEEVQQILKEKPVIFVTAHFGNWELLPLSLGSHITPISAIARKIDNPKLNKEIISSREKFNIKVFYKQGALKNMINSIKEKRSIGILVDQNTAKNEGIETTFFNKRVLQTPSAATLSKKFNLPIVMVFIEPTENKKWKLVVKDIFYTTDIQESVNRQSQLIEEEVKKFPNEYYWFHKRFKHFYEDLYA